MVDQPHEQAKPPLPLAIRCVKKMRPSYRPSPGKKVHGMRATGALMGCPGRSSCVFDTECPVDFYGDPPSHWTACYLEVVRYDQLREGLIPWILEARRRSKIVNPMWLEEVSEAYIEAQIRFERLRRYAIGMDLPVGWPEYFEDPIVERFHRRVTEQRDELRFYLHELINLLRVAAGTHRTVLLPGHRTRAACSTRRRRRSQSCEWPRRPPRSARRRP